MIENTREIYESLYPRIFNQHYGMCSEEFNKPFDYFEGYDYLISIIEEKNKEIERLNKGIKLLQKQNREKQKIIYNTIEYIKEHTNNLVEYLDVFEAQDLANILQGSDKN